MRCLYVLWPLKAEWCESNSARIGSCQKSAFQSLWS